MIHTRRIDELGGRLIDKWVPTTAAIFPNWVSFVLHGAVVSRNKMRGVLGRDRNQRYVWMEKLDIS